MTTALDTKDAAASTDAPTTAAFSPASASSSSYLPRQRTSILVHQKSPLLLATPPQITRALAYSHPFLLPLNKTIGLLAWTTDDPWESFLLLAGFWAATLYGDVLVRWAGPLLIVVSLVLLMYTRRFSPLSSAGGVGPQRAASRKGSNLDAKSRHHKSLDEIVDTLRIFTSRCNVLLDPFIRLTDFLSTQSTATSATVRPSLTTLFLRILLLTPVWIILALPRIRIITTRRFILTIGTFALSYHSRPARISRTILWRSRTIRRLCALITGLRFTTVENRDTSTYGARRLSRAANSVAAALLASRNAKSNGAPPSKEGIRFTFVLYENQRRWIGIGWTSSMLAYERTAWTDDQQEPSVHKDKFALPEVEGGFAEWRWCEGSDWTVEGSPEAERERSSTGLNEKATTGTTGGTKGKELARPSKEVLDPGGWTYYDNKWHLPRQEDGWGKYTRRRKWCRDAELIEVDTSTETAPALPDRPKKGSSASSTIQYVPSPTKSTTRSSLKDQDTGYHSSPADRKAKRAAAKMDTAPASAGDALTLSDTASGTGTPVGSAKERRPWFGRRRTNSKVSNTDDEDHERDRDAGSGSGRGSGSFVFSLEEEDGYVPMSHRGRQGGMLADWGIGEDVSMDLG